MTNRAVSESIVVAAPAAVIFAILADPRQHHRIDGSGSVQSIVSAPARLTRGTSFSVGMRLFGVRYVITNRVVEYHEDRLIAWRHFAGHRWRYELRPEGAERTRVVESFDYSRVGLLAASVLHVLRFPARNRRGIQATLPRLKAAAEAEHRAA
ncbi:SRPBCC family protein [Jiangella alkaliphila]|uniref:Polyketide cyclase / dehydrase and lipid transport n=1 Tax=Jiangella alkaliphila TaxID=419479 RepID=A0A1H2L7I4_9ACTN|nr:SRPBCC family protein [Jiangella alkaliphila]SDU76909.1 Polyketide cyclase / dehydrase and lipid transport [Jiangella alkaliphila]